MGRPKGSKNKPKEAPIEKKVQPVPVKKKASRKPKSAQRTAEETATLVKKAIRDIQNSMKNRDFGTWDEVGGNYWYSLPHHKDVPYSLVMRAQPSARKATYALYILSKSVKEVGSDVYEIDKVQVKKINEKSFELSFSLKDAPVWSQVYSF